LKPFKNAWEANTLAIKENITHIHTPLKQLYTERKRDIERHPIQKKKK